MTWFLVILLLNGYNLSVEVESEDACTIMSTQIVRQFNDNNVVAVVACVEMEVEGEEV